MHDIHQKTIRESVENKKYRWSVLAILCTLMGFASISTDLYLPAMPNMSYSLHISPGVMEWTVSGYLIGFSLGQLLWGPIGDRCGRRLPVALGLLLFTMGSAGCALSDNAVTLISWRIVQAVGACAGVVLARAMVRDLYKGEYVNQMMSTLMMVMAIAPLAGPIVGGQILIFAGWRAIFWTLVGVGFITLAAFIILMPETLPPEHRNQEHLKYTLISYGQQLANRKLLAYASAGGFLYGGIFAYISGTPFAYITFYHVSEQDYGLLFGIAIIGIMAANFFNARLVQRFGGLKLLQWSSAMAALSGIFTAVAARTGFDGLWGIAIPLFIFMSMNGFIIANSIAGALAIFPERAGTVSALVGAIQYGSGIIGSGLVGAFADGTPWPLGAVIAFAGIGCLITARSITP